MPKKSKKSNPLNDAKAQVEIVKQGVMAGKAFLAARVPVSSREEAEQYRQLSYFIDKTWDKVPAHLYAVYYDQIEQKITATTSYNSPSDPPKLIFRGPSNPVHDRDIQCVTDVAMYLKYKTRVEELELTEKQIKMLAKLNAKARDLTRNPQNTVDYKYLNVDCQTGTWTLLKEVLSSEELSKLKLPKGTKRSGFDSNARALVVSPNKITTPRQYRDRKGSSKKWLRPSSPTPQDTGSNANDEKNAEPPRLRPKRKAGKAGMVPIRLFPERAKRTKSVQDNTDETSFQHGIN